MAQIFSNGTGKKEILIYPELKTLEWWISGLKFIHSKVFSSGSLGYIKNQNVSGYI